MTTIKSSTQPAPPSSSSTHRLPTFSASQALQSLKASDKHTSISTSLPRLDALLGGGGVISSNSTSYKVGNDDDHLDDDGDDDDDDDDANLSSDENDGESEQSEKIKCGGIRRGQLTEVYGPPGVGKTAFCMQLAANAIKAGDEAVWVDCSSPIVSSRFLQIYRSVLGENLNPASRSDRKKNNEDDGGYQNRPNWTDRFHHLTAPTLAHLLALFLHPPRSTLSSSSLSSSNFLPPRTALLVIDSISTVFDNLYRQDRGRGRQQQPQAPQHSYASSLSNRSVHSPNVMSKSTSSHSQPRHLVLSDLITRLSSLAAIHNIAVIYTSQTATRLVRYRSINAHAAVDVAATSSPSTSSLSLATVPTLCPVLGGGNNNNSNADWHASVAVRIVLFRDWIDGYVYARKRKDDDGRVTTCSVSPLTGLDEKQEEENVESQVQDQNHKISSQGETPEPAHRIEKAEVTEQHKGTEGTDGADNRPDVKRKRRTKKTKKTKVRIKDARFAALLKVRYIPLAEDAALRRAVCFDIEKDGGLVSVFTFEPTAAAEGIADISTLPSSSLSSSSPPPPPTTTTTMTTTLTSIASSSKKPEIPPTAPTITTAHAALVSVPVSVSVSVPVPISTPAHVITTPSEPTTNPNHTLKSTTALPLPKRPYAEIADSDDDDDDDDDADIENDEDHDEKEREEEEEYIDCNDGNDDDNDDGRR